MDVDDGTSGFDTLFTSVNVPHILEKIFFSLDYESLKACHQVNGAWRQLLSSDKYQSMLKEKRKNEDNIFKASATGNAQVVWNLLSIGVNPNCGRKNIADDGIGWYSSYWVSCLFIAVLKGRKVVVQLLLDGGADPNKANENGETPLRQAAEDGHQDVVKLLLDKGADPDKADRDGYTPLQLATEYGHIDIIQLLDSGADPHH